MPMPRMPTKACWISGLRMFVAKNKVATDHAMPSALPPARCQMHPTGSSSRWTGSATFI